MGFNMKNKMGTGLITSLSHDGRGIAHINGKTTFIEGVLVGEEVEFEYSKVKSRYDEARVTNVLTRSSARQSPVCTVFGECGGCSLQHMDTNHQLEHKMSVLLEQLYHLGGIKSVDILPAVTSAPWGYRRKARLGVRYVIKKEKLLIGFREKNGRYLADVSECPVLVNSVGNQIETLREFLLNLDDYRSIPQLEVAVGDEVTAIIIRHLNPLSEKDLEKIVSFGKRMQFHLYLQPKGPDSVKRLYPLEGDERLSYRLEQYGLEMRFHPTDFVQVNAEVNNKLIDLAIELMAPKSDESFLDLFCGIGNFTLPLALHSKHVVGIEGSQEMVHRGYENAQHNNISNVSFDCQDLQNTHYNDKYMSQKFDGVLLDPPRAGAWEVIQMLPHTNTKRVVYISCNPATLARDAGGLKEKGYELVKVGVLDMFPHTSHVESIALFVKK